MSGGGDDRAARNATRLAEKRKREAEARLRAEQESLLKTNQRRRAASAGRFVLLDQVPAAGAVQPTKLSGVS